MNSKATLLLLILGYTFPIYAQTTVNENVGASFVGRKSAKAQVELSISIVNQVSCAPDHIGFTLNLVFRNISREPVILSKKYLLGGVSVSSDAKAAAAKQYETYLIFDMYGSGEGLTSPDISDFMILRPGEDYETENKVSILTSNVTPRAGGYLRPGTHLLQVAVGTWPYIADPKPYQKRWREKGFLWSQGLISLPLPFSFDKDRPISKCPTDTTSK